MLDELKTVPAGAFDAIDESSLMVDPNSGRVRGGVATAPTPSPAPRTTARPAPPRTTAPPRTNSASSGASGRSPSFGSGGGSAKSTFFGSGGGAIGTIGRTVAFDSSMRPPTMDTHPITDRGAWAAGLRAMVAVPAVQAEILRAASYAETAMAAAVADRVGVEVGDLYPKLVASAALGAFNVVSHHYTEAAERSGEFPDMLADALGMVRAGLPPP